jgi:NADH-quinone oxidoreductase subunit J
MGGEQALFWVMAPLAVLGALGLVFFRKAVHGALCLALTMVSLALFYIAQEAPFLGVVQVVVYTGAVMMLFLFVIMLVGVEASDSRVETIRGQRGAAALVVVGVVILLTTVVGQATLPPAKGLDEAAPDGNVVAIADLIFGTYVWVFEVVAALLITAAVGAVALTHREHIFRRPNQRELAARRFRDGRPQEAAGLPVPGVYARHNAVDTPALLPDGTPSQASVSRVLVARGAARSAREFTKGPAEVLSTAEAGGRAEALSTAEAGEGSAEALSTAEAGGRAEALSTAEAKTRGGGRS